MEDNDVWLRHGIRKEWFDNGKKKVEGFYFKGLRYGIRIEWLSNGQIKMIDFYNKCGESYETIYWNSDDAKIVTIKRKHLSDFKTCTEERIKISQQSIRNISILRSNRDGPKYETNLKGWVDKYGFKPLN